MVTTATLVEVVVVTTLPMGEDKAKATKAEETRITKAMVASRATKLLPAVPLPLFTSFLKTKKISFPFLVRSWRSAVLLPSLTTYVLICNLESN